MPETLHEMVGRKILDVRPMNFAELRYENASEGILISLTKCQAIVIYIREDGEKIVRWQDCAGSVSMPDYFEETYQGARR
jgi:hypothetical protein